MDPKYSTLSLSANGDTSEGIDESRRKMSDFYEKQSQLFQSVLAHVDEQVQNQMDRLCSEQQMKVLVIYTGGTIGMVNTEMGYTIKKGYLSEAIKSNKYLCDTGYTFLNSEDDFMITPVSIYKKRIWFKLIEFDEIRDSSTFNTDDWVNIATYIEQNYDKYNSFVILHGTDTMAYTTSALSFMLENLTKTVVFTGSQVPLSEMRNDAFDNFLGAITIAGHFTIPEVTLFFRDKLYRGNRATKIDTFDLGAFDSPNLSPLGSFGFYFKLDWSLIRKLSYQKFSVHKNLSKKVCILKIFPMISADIIESIFNSPNVDACVIEAYGAGNLPINRPDIAAVLSAACLKGKNIVIISQCQRGAVNAIYAIGRQVKEMGIVSGMDMTAECAVAKLSYLLGKGYNFEEIQKLMLTNLRGELTEVVHQHFHMNHNSIIEAISDAVNSSGEHQQLKDAVFPTILCYAADFGYTNIFEEAKRFEINFDSGDYQGRTPLHVAASKGHVQVLQYLIKEKANINSADKRGRNALWKAIYNRQFEAVKVLIKAGGKVIVSDEELGDFLFKLVAKGDLETLQYLFFAGIRDLNGIVNVDKRSLGHIAVAEDQLKIVEFLRNEVDFNFNVKDRWGYTPLDEAKLMRM